MKSSFFTQPFKVANITEDKNSPLLKLMLMSASPGILDGDDYEIKIDVTGNSSLQLQTQSYQRLFNMKNGASQKTEVQVAAGGSFFYLPHPSVPHEASSFFSKNTIWLQSGCTLLWGEVITCGRKQSGESFLFSKFHTLTEIYVSGKLVIRENVLIQPSVTNVHALGQLEGYTHQATMIFLKELSQPKYLIAAIAEFLSEKKEIEFGITATPVDGIILRLLGFKAEQLFDVLQSVANTFLLQNHPAHVR
ncbi:urease accessory protein UreD [Ferruginibacter sp. HRS2-29]|uniref:urease accessory protein UreD n=1 Tax=Ferruginibacter sp. HRS2-29 TaxID=2487334 RepID=UPI0020CDF9E2|nr:urease accessory protein UreD [Ferruginibacter sp. HRS2-29]